VLLTYEKPAALEVSPGILFGGNCPLGFISVAACCCHSRGWLTFGNVSFFFPSHSSFMFGHKWRPCKTESSAVI